MADRRREIYNGIYNICESIKTGRFIMSNSAIAKLLQYVAKHEESLSFLQKCNNQYDYKSEFKSAINIVGSSKFFKLPENPYRVVSLVMGVLYDLDRENIHVTSFLKEYFDFGDVDDNYVAFAKQFITPLQEAYEAMCYDYDVTIEDIAEESNAKPINEAIGEQILPFMITLSDMVVSENGFSANKRQEFLDILEGMCYAIEQGSTKWLKFMWIGLKNTFASYRLANSILNGIRSLLTTYGIIND